MALQFAMSDSNPSKPRSSVVGQQGEAFVTQWLQQQGWSILARGWTSRWGELDVVALYPQGTCPPSCLAFVEVKTRSRGNWDENGLLAITPTKQAKLWKTARLFLAQHPHLAEVPCRFDVALVTIQRVPSAQRLSLQSPIKKSSGALITLQQPFNLEGYQLTLQTYLESAFELSD
jgi:putative endonuclease